MKNMVKIILPAMIMLALSLPFVWASQGEANMYFNAATKKYISGNFTEALTNLEKAHELDPNSEKIKDFAVKILLEAASHDRLAKKNEQANEYLDRAKDLEPDNPKVQDMDKLLNPEKAKASQNEKDKNTQAQNGERKKHAKGEDDRQEVVKKNADNSVQMEKKIQEMIDIQQKAVKRGFAQRFLGEMKEWQLRSLTVWFLLSTVISIVFVIYMMVRHGTVKENQKRIAEQDLQQKSILDERNVLQSEKSNLLVEMEKIKERCKYEHQSLENMQKELEQNKIHQEQFLRVEFENKNKEMEQKIRAEIMKKYLAPEGQKEKFVQHQEEKFIKYVNEAAVPPPEAQEADPILASARERIALMAQNLYEYAPGAAVEFITKMAKNENPLIRTNIVQALANIAKPETFDLLFELYDDSDLRVKREVLRNLKLLNQRVLTGEITLDETVAEEINALITQEKGKGEWIL
jgi:hypothetical protein